MSDELSLEALYEDAPCGYLSLDPDGIVVRVNRTLLRSIGADRESVVGRPLLELLTGGSRLYAQTHWWPLLQLQGELREMPVDLVRPDGTRLCVLLSARRTAPPESGAGYRVVLFDATDRRNYEQQLIAARDEERAAREQVERLQRTSSALATASGVERVAEAIADGIEDALAPQACGVRLGDRLLVDRRDPFARATGATTLEVPLEAGGKRIGALTVELASDRFPAAPELAFVDAVAAQGATALRRAHLHAETRRLAFHDALTGLPNRLALHEHLEAQLALLRDAGEPFTVAVLGLDDFKLLNDTRGHAFGDDVLRCVARRLEQAVRAGDFVARLSGDEFAVVWRGAAGDADAVARRLVEALARALRVDRSELYVRAAIGTAVASADQDAERLMADAEVAMFAAKAASGSDPVAFHAALREQAHERARVEAELRDALREGQLRVFYQPIVCAADGSLTALEALVRWEHPQRGLISPAVFVPVAEETGLIVELGRWVLREACGQLATWRAAGTVGDHVGVTVNVSGRQLVDGSLVQDVAEVLDATGLAQAPALLGLELTESMLMSAERDPEARLGALSDLGVRLLLDDFGTGASSLSRLRRLPFDTLKIDRSFIAGLGDQPGGEDEAIVAAILALAGALGLDVVAEGVETAEQADRLRDLGADKLQGYRFSRPLPATELPAFLHEHTVAVASA